MVTLNHFEVHRKAGRRKTNRKIKKKVFFGAVVVSDTWMFPRNPELTMIPTRNPELTMIPTRNSVFYDKCYLMTYLVKCSPFFRLVDPVWVSVPILQTGWPCVCVRPHSSDWLTLRDCVSVCPHSSDWLTLRVCVRPHSSDWLTLCVCVCPHSLTVWHCVTLCLSPFFRLVDPVTVWVSVPILQTGYQTRLLVITCTVLYIPTIQTCCQSQTHLLVIIVHSHSSESGSFSNPNTVLVIIIQPHSSGWLSDPISNYCPLPCILRLTWGWHDINIQEHTIPFFRMVVRLFVPSLLDPVNIYCPPRFLRMVVRFHHHSGS